MKITTKDELIKSAKTKRLIPDVIAVIPAYNAESTIKLVVSKVRRKIERCIVVDDGSSDKTGVLAKEAGAELLIHVSNRGKGAAIKSAFDFLKKQNFKYLILLDADGQHEPGELFRLVQQAKRNRADVVCGNRMKNTKNMPKLRVITNKIMSKITSWLCWTNLSDTQCGYRLVSKRAVNNIKIKKDNFEVDTEILFQASKLGYRISEATVSTIYTEDHASHINPVKDTLRFFRLAIRLLITRLTTKRKQIKKEYVSKPRYGKRNPRFSKRPPRVYSK